MSTRAGGVSSGAFASLNLGSAVGDDTQAVAANRARFAAALEGARPMFLRQVHGCRVLRLPDDAVGEGAEPPEADASFTTQPGIACVIQVADCLPVLLAAPAGRGVAAAHAGWRGLAGGVLEATLAALCDAAGCAPAEVEAWLGPCIGPRQFEVGADVLAGFGVAADAAEHPRFRPRGAGKWLADLPGLARDRLSAQGVLRIGGGGWCTVEDASRFFSYRRDRLHHGNSGRMAAAIWIEPG
ncbi:MAG: peptidoglycan editing factor PgeF [Pseudomonadota bacterium]